MTPDEKRDEMQLLLLREAASLIVFAAVMAALSPPVQLWLRHLAWQARKWRRRDADAAERAVAEVRSEISRMEHGG